MCGRRSASGDRGVTGNEDINQPTISKKRKSVPKTHPNGGRNERKMYSEVKDINSTLQ